MTHVYIVRQQGAQQFLTRHHVNSDCALVHAVRVSWCVDADGQGVPAAARCGGGHHPRDGRRVRRLQCPDGHQPRRRCVRRIAARLFGIIMEELIASTATKQDRLHRCSPGALRAFLTDLTANAVAPIMLLFIIVLSLDRPRLKLSTHACARDHSAALCRSYEPLPAPQAR